MNVNYEFNGFDWSELVEAFEIIIPQSIKEDSKINPTTGRFPDEDYQIDKIREIFDEASHILLRWDNPSIEKIEWANSVEILVRNFLTKMSSVEMEDPSIYLAEAMLKMNRHNMFRVLGHNLGYMWN